ncbi:DEAD/DEAH box helicase [Streptomyces sp. WAC08241]|uniref:DEAD/DEAH box helicase n=1 Tax=Streptomyces sp. WAC08241 TaxID=2487421 RepID=UPI00163BF4F5|nr:SNF2-related protein [Streptomyces sp. WAC08241]
MGTQSRTAGVGSSSPSAGGSGAPWHERARDVVAFGGFDPRLAAEAEELALAGGLTPRDLRILLLVTGDHPGWLPARRCALAALDASPETPHQVLALHAQLEAWAPPAYAESSERAPHGEALHRAEFRIGPADAVVNGPARTAPSPERARRAAADAMLRALAGVGAERLRLPGMTAELFDSLLSSRLESAAYPGEELHAELVRRAAASRLRHRDALRLLFDTTAPGWREVRLLALDHTARVPPTPATLLQWRAEACRAELRHTAVERSGGFASAWSWEEADGRVRTGPERVSDDRRASLHAAAVALLALLCGLPEPRERVVERPRKAPPRIQPVPRGEDPVKYLNKYTQLEVITKPELGVVSRPKTIVCTYTCRHVATGRTVRGAGTARVKGDARQKAAAALLEELARLDARPARRPERSAPPAPPSPAPVVIPRPRPAGPVAALPPAPAVNPPAGPSVFLPAPRAEASVAPEGPVTPEGPVAPEGRVVPEESVVPDGPVVPEGSVVPDGPVAPEGRVVSEGSVVPEGPVVPEGSVVPEGPVTPEGPVAPEALIAPEVPVPPGTLVTPESPEVPEAPVAPDVPEAPWEGLSAGAVAGEALAAGCALSLVPPPAGGPAAGMFLYRADGAPMPEVPLPVPLAATVRRLGVPAADGLVEVTGWHLPLDEAVPLLLGRSRFAAWHPTAVEWEQAARLGVRLVAAGLVRPALGTDGTGRWRVGPLPDAALQAVDELAHHMSPHAHAVVGDGPAPSARDAVLVFLDSVADGLVRTPAAVMFGSGPFTGPAGGRVPPAEAEAVRPWLDALEDRLDDGPPPRLVLEMEEPSEREALAGRLTGRLLLDTGPGREGGEVAAHLLWSGRAFPRGVDRHRSRERVGRRLERLERLCPGLSGLASRPGAFTVDAAGIARLLRAEEELAAAGLLLRWPDHLRRGLSSYAVVGTTTATAGGTGAPGFGLRALLDFRWQVALGDDTLDEAEMDALAEAARPLVRVRGRWVLLDPTVRARARRRELGRLAGVDALAAALTGTVGVDGHQVTCRATGDLAGVVATLRRGEHVSPVAVPSRLRAVLRGYQERALAWLAHTGGVGFGAVLADDMGLGKTLTAIAYVLHRHETGHTGPVLVVCPSSLVTNWQREIDRFAPHLDVVRYHGADRSLDAVGGHTVVLTTYGVLRRDAELAGVTWDLVVADEAQHTKNHASATARALRSLPSTARLALTGTPVENNLSELWSLIDWANPGLFGTLEAFRSRYAAAAEREPDGPAARALARLVAPFVLRRTKSDPGIAPELPAKVETRRIVDLTPEQVALYEAVVRETMDRIAGSCAATRSGLVLKLITALKQITNHPAHYLRETHPGPAHVRRFGRRSAKLEALVELTGAIARRGEAALVFTGYVAMGRLLEEHLAHLGHRPLFLHGGLDAGRRQQLVDTFQGGGAPLLVLSLRAGGTGLNLTRASHVVHFDRSWNAAVEDQASDRAHRIGQRRTVTVHRLVTRGTIEDRIDRLLAHKRALQNTVLASGGTGLARLTDRELTELVRLGAPR